MTNLEDILYHVDHNEVAEEIALMLTDQDIPTYDMFEDLVINYDAGSPDFKAGMDKALEIIIWRTVPDLAKYIKETCTVEGNL